MKKGWMYGILFFFLWIGMFFLLEGILRVMGIGYSTEPFERVAGTPYFRDNPDFLNKYYPGRRTPRSEAKFKNLFLAQKPTNGLRIFVLGGSTAQGWPFEPNQSFTKMIEIQLQFLLPEKHIEVINLGYSAMSSYYVADVTRKLARYQPDIIVLYTGQNEYYGTLSVTTGGGDLSKQIYLFLREWRIFQILFALFEKSQKPSKTMMAAQFSGRQLPMGEKDAEVADAFRRNLTRVFSWAKKHHVEVIVYKMAANLIHMPPFASEGEREVAPLILSNTHFFRHETWQTVSTAQLLSNWRTTYPNNAHILYLDGLARRARKEEFLDILKQAKDRDTIPFRYREILQDVLSNAGAHWHVSFIPLHQKIKEVYGSEGFGRKLFIDHLHFNYTGQRLLANLGVEAVLSLKDFKTKAPSSNALPLKEVSHLPGLAHEDWIDAGLWLTVYDEFMAIQNILTLLSQSPYKDMLIPYTKDPAWGEIGMLTRKPFSEILASFSSKKNQSFGNYLLSRLTDNKEWETIEVLLQAYRHNNPGIPTGYKNCAEFYTSRNRYEEAIQFYAMAYLLAEKKERLEIEKKGQSLARMLGKPDQWRETIDFLAKNPWPCYNSSNSATVMHKKGGNREFIGEIFEGILAFCQGK
ncbi:SGNH/GDSL hydrolase family protein [Thermospira aquatica]|uniref:SGNH/GDSL hydrolase family protein n=1 Tax=Thermospira aquatica TaxID=2828656 RepID=A0AAX3BCM7_9SPIR|nr:hypothetical protein [Thermospira aquatica]URA10025.1 SGNH/GDSL hydrolase family protein [Thermospira aquatica]